MKRHSTNALLLRVHLYFDVQTVVAFAVSWTVVALTAGVASPLKYPNEMPGTYIDETLVPALLLPLLIGCRFLTEGPNHLVAAASKPLHVTRTMFAALYVAVQTVVFMVVAVLVTVPTTTLFLDLMLGCGLVLLGTAMLGNRYGWLPAAVVFVAFSIPFLVPFEANVMYRLDAHPAQATIAVPLLIAGVVTYARWGTTGAIVRRVLDTADTNG